MRSIKPTALLSSTRCLFPNQVRLSKNANDQSDDFDRACQSLVPLLRDTISIDTRWLVSFVKSVLSLNFEKRNDILLFFGLVASR